MAPTAGRVPNKALNEISFNVRTRAAQYAVINELLYRTGRGDITSFHPDHLIVLYDRIEAGEHGAA